MRTSRRTFITTLVTLAALNPRHLLAGGHNPFCSYRSSGGAYLKEQSVLVFGRNHEQHFALARQSGRPTTVLVETKEQYNRAYTALRGNALPAGSSVLFDKSNDPGPFIDTFDDPLRKIVIIHNVPKNLEQALALHGKEYTEEQIKAALPHLRNVATFLENNGAVSISDLSGGNLADRLSNRIKQANKRDLILIVSHVEQNPFTLLYPESYEFPVVPLTDNSKFDTVWRAPSTSAHFARELSNDGNFRNDFLYKQIQHEATVWTIGCNTWLPPKMARMLSGIQLETTRTISYGQGAGAAVGMLKAGTLREAINYVQFTQKLRTRPEFETPSIDTRKETSGAGKAEADSHEDTEAPRETYQLRVDITPGKSVYSNMFA